MRTLARASVVLFAALALQSAIPAQNQLWLRQFGTIDWDSADAAAPDMAGGAYVCGVTFGDLSGPNAGLQDAWLARYDGSGKQLWIRQIGTSGVDGATAAAPDGAGGVYVSGSTDGSLGGPSAGLQDIWLAHYDSVGNQLWIKQFGASDHEDSRAAASDGAGGVYLGGWTYSSLGGPNAGGADPWFARYDSAGSQLWIKQLGTSGHDQTWAAAPDGAGGVYVSGSTDGSLGGPSAGLKDTWLAHYDGAGNQLWIRQVGTFIHDECRAAAPDGAGGVYIGGATGPQPFIMDAWLARYDATGSQLWIRQFGTSKIDWTFVAVADGASGVYMGGYTDGDLGGPNVGARDAWLGHSDSTGNQLSFRQLGSISVDWEYAAASDGAGGVYVGGGTQGSLGGQNTGSSDVWLARYSIPPGIYCTAKPNSCGTLPAIGSTGTPSSTSGSGFTVSAANAKALKAGLLIYTDSGSGNAPFSGGTLCLNTMPLKRSIAVFDTTGTLGQCDGTLSIDMNAFAVGALGGNPLSSLTIPGTQVNCQFWGRDTIANGALLSDALEFFVGS